MYRYYYRSSSIYTITPSLGSRTQDPVPVPVLMLCCACLCLQSSRSPNPNPNPTLSLVSCFAPRIPSNFAIVPFSNSPRLVSSHSSSILPILLLHSAILAPVSVSPPHLPTPPPISISVPYSTSPVPLGPNLSLPSSPRTP